MKANWHNSVSRYMLSNEDFSVFKLLVRELNNALNRAETNRKIVAMNRQLEESAVCDVLTGLYNRAGLYREVARITPMVIMWEISFFRKWLRYSGSQQEMEV